MKNELIAQIAAIKGKTKVIHLSRILAGEDIDLNELIDLTFNDDDNLSFKAAWLLENLLLKHPERFLPYIGEIISRLKDIKNPSCKRHYAKILMHLTAKKAPKFIKQKLAEIDLEPVIEQSFNWMIDPEVLVAVKAFAAETLFNLRNYRPWIAAELASQLEFLMQNGSMAIQTKGRKLLNSLEAEKNGFQAHH